MDGRLSQFLPSEKFDKSPPCSIGLSRRPGAGGARQREAARTTVAEFVQKWLMTQTAWKPHGDKPVQVLFADEPIEALDAACDAQPGCAAAWVGATGL